MRTTALSLVVLAALGLAGPVASQDAAAPRIQPGTRMRVYETSAAAVEGTASAFDVTMRPRTLGISLSLGF
jgi:hypothetical protein